MPNACPQQTQRPLAVRPFLKWPGGKFRILNILAAHLPPNKILVEPFVGAGSVFLNIPFDNYIVNDLNPDLIHLFDTVKHDSQTFIQEASKLFTPRHNCAKRYYELRKKFNLSKNAFERSILFLYLNKHGYNGLCRYNARGGYNVPFGSYKKPRFPENEILAFVQKSQLTQLANLSFIEFFDWVCTTHHPKNLTIYCDPPYAPLSATANFTGYSAQKFTLDDQETLAKLALQTSKRGANVIISNHDTAFTRRLYKPAKIISLQVQRAISCKAASRQKVKELLAIYSA